MREKKGLEGYLAFVTHKSFCDGIDRMEDQEFGNTWRGRSSQFMLWVLCQSNSVPEVPEPNTRAAPESLLLPAGGDMAEIEEGGRKTKGSLLCALDCYSTARNRRTREILNEYKHLQTTRSFSLLAFYISLYHK